MRAHKIDRRPRQYADRRTANIINGKKGTEALKLKISKREPWKCAQCGKTAPATVHMMRQKYCSAACMAEVYKTSLTGTKNPNYKNAGTKKCLGCDQEFFSYNKDRKYCCRNCYNGIPHNADGSMKYAARKDANHAEVVKAFEAGGACVIDTSRMGGGFPDTLIWSGTEWLLVEIKNPKTSYGRKGLSSRQKRFSDEWFGMVIVVKSADEAIEVLNKSRQGKDITAPQKYVVNSVEQALQVVKEAP